MYGIDHRISKYFDWISSCIIILLSVIGLFFVFSATCSPTKPFSIFFIKQAIGLIGGFVIYLGCCVTDYRTLLRWGYFAYIGVIGLLIFTLVKGSMGLGAQRWLDLGFMKLQPSELAKLLFPTFAAYHLDIEKDAKQTFIRTFLPMLCILGVSFILILKQPDLGTALIIAYTGFILLWLAGLPKKFFLWSAVILCIFMPLIWHYVLKPYQKNRIVVFLGYGDNHKERYQIEQATIAIGSGGMWGKGSLQGTQNKLRFLPESRTDFIFAVLCEEWGLAGALFLLFMYILLFWRCIGAVLSLSDPTIQLFALGAVIHIILSTIINIGMVVGLIPIVGIPLPLMSYGLSNLWVTYASLGWFARITMQQKYLEEYMPSFR
jgi:rod shape determining protein RodA